MKRDDIPCDASQYRYKILRHMVKLRRLQNYHIMCMYFTCKLSFFRQDCFCLLHVGVSCYYNMSFSSLSFQDVDVIKITLITYVLISIYLVLIWIPTYTAHPLTKLTLYCSTTRHMVHLPPDNSLLTRRGASGYLQYNLYLSYEHKQYISLHYMGNKYLQVRTDFHTQTLNIIWKGPV